jgi:hypothetical protein
MKIVVFFLCLLAFNLSFAINFVDQPKACFEKEALPCAIQIMSQPAHLKWGEIKINALAKSSFILEKNQQIKLLQGSLWLDGESYKVKLSYATITANGEAIFENQKEKSIIQNLSAELAIQGLTSENAAFALKGTQIWMAGISSDNHQVQGVIEPIEVKSFLNQAKAYRLGKGDFKAKLAKWKSEWEESKESTYHFYQEVAQRKVASVEEKNRHKSEAEQKARIENQNLRKLFREKNYLE